ncbi:unnamed protein product [Effrenium voratum]|nr:unnamed protein product [Effrenium voratum]CAJ1437903.1 unnamed protein product [Effrenium voratum]
MLSEHGRRSDGTAPQGGERGDLRTVPGEGFLPEPDALDGAQACEPCEACTETEPVQPAQAPPAVCPNSPSQAPDVSQCERRLIVPPKAWMGRLRVIACLLPDPPASGPAILAGATARFVAPLERRRGGPSEAATTVQPCQSS